MAAGQNSGGNSGSSDGNSDGNSGSLSGDLSAGDSTGDRLADAQKALVSEWVGKGEETLQFRVDGTCAVNGQTMRYTVELGTGMERAYVYLGESKETAAASLTLRLYEGNMCVLGDTFPEDGEYRLVAAQKGSLLTTDCYYDMDDLQRVELSADNWGQYFELKETTSISKNGFGEIERFHVNYYFQIKEQYRNRVNTTLSSGSVGTMQASGIFSCTITDLEQGTYQINGAINPDELEERVDDFRWMTDGLYGTSVASAVMYCSDGSSYDAATATGTLLNWPDQLAVNRVTGTIYLQK